MGFFSELKEDLSQAMNELMPEEAPGKGEEKKEASQEPLQEEKETQEAGPEDLKPEALEPEVSIEEMLKNIDSIQLEEAAEQVNPVEESTGLAGVQRETAEKSLEIPEMPDSLPDIDEGDLDAMIARASGIAGTVPDAVPTEPGEENVGGVSELMGSGAEYEEKLPETAENGAGTLEVSDTYAVEAKTDQIVAQKEENKGEERKMDMEMEMENQVEQEAADVNREAVDETSIITAAMTITGDVETEGSIEVIGTVNGNIDAYGKLTITGHINGNSKASEIYAESAKINGEIISEGAVKIGASSVIIGNITATSAAIAGAVKGDIDVRGPVILDASAIVMGNIKSKSVQINNGAVIEGMCSQCYADVSPTSFFDEYKPEPRKSRAK